MFFQLNIAIYQYTSGWLLYCYASGYRDSKSHTYIDISQNAYLCIKFLAIIKIGHNAWPLLCSRLNAVNAPKYSDESDFSKKLPEMMISDPSRFMIKVSDYHV